MTEADEMCGSVTVELNNSGTDEPEGEQEGCTLHEEAAAADIPPSLLSYFETSKTRAAVCEKLILEEFEDFTVPHHTGGEMDLPFRLKMQVVCETESEENKTGGRLLPAPTGTQKPLTDVSVCPDNEDESGTDEYEEDEKYLALKISEYEAEREKHLHEEMQKEEQRRQRESDFQEELRRIMEAEKLHQTQLEMMEKRAQEKLEQELLLQQELISTLQKRVTRERRMIEEEKRRKKDEERKMREEEEKKKRREEEEKRKKEEMERKMREEEEKRKKEEMERKMREKEEKRKKEEMERKMREEEERRKKEEEERKMREVEEKKKRREEEEKRKKEEMERKMREEEEKRKKEEMERKMREKEEKRKKEEMERKMREEEERRKKEEEERKMREVEEKKKRREEEEKRKKEEMERKMREEEEKRKKEEEERKMREVEEKKKRREEEDKKKKKEEEEGKVREEEENRKREEEDKRKQEEMKRLEEEKEEKRKRVEMRLKEEEDRRKEEERKLKEIQVKAEEKNRQIEEEERKKKDENKAEKNRKRENEKTRTKEYENSATEVDEKSKQEATKLKDEMKKIEDEERKKRDEEEKRKLVVEVKIMKGLQVGTMEEVIGKEEERRKLEVGNKMVNEQMRRKEDEEKRHGGKNENVIRKEEEKKTKEEEQVVRQEAKMRSSKEEEHRNTEEEMEATKECDEKEKGERQEEVKKHREKDGMGKKDNIQSDKRPKDNREEEEGRQKKKEPEEEGKQIRMNELQETKRENHLTSQTEKTVSSGPSLTSQLGDMTTRTSLSSDPSHSESTATPTSSETAHHLDKNIRQTFGHKTMDQQAPGVKPLPLSLPEHTEQKRLSWMKDCIPWSKLSLQNKKKQKPSVRSRRGPRRAAEASSLPPLCPDTLLQSTGWKSLHEVTTVTLEDLPGCSLSTLVQCTQLQFLTLRRCGLRSLEGINQLRELCYIDVQENDISFVDCENMTSLRVLRLAHNKLTSIHGLSGAENLDVLDLSHNFISRIAGLESVRRLQRLSVGHNQLISTKGLRNVYTLLHLDCSHNHLVSVEGLENNALLHTLHLRANSLTEPPSLNNQVLLRELHLDDNSIWSLQGLAACWLPLLQHLSVAQNRITHLPSMSDFVSLENLDLRFNCLSELQSMCEALEGCRFLREVHLTGNPLQQERGWRSTLQKAVPGLRAIDSQQTDSFLPPPAVQRVSWASGCLLTFCQAQLQQTRDLQQRHSRELSSASSSLDAVKSFCRHFTATLKLAEDQRFAHEYGDTTVCDEPWAAGQTTPEKTLNIDGIIADYSEMNSTDNIPPINTRCSYWGSEETSAGESQRDTFDSFTRRPTAQPTVSKANSTSFNPKAALASNHQDLDVKNSAAVVIQQRWRKYRQKCGNINASPIAEMEEERGGVGGKPELGSTYINRSAVGQHRAATVIQAFWRGFALRRRLTSALAAVTCSNAGEDDTLEEVDMDEFVFDEVTLEKYWKLTASEDSPPRHHPVSEQLLSLQPPGPSLDPSQYTLPPSLVLNPKQAWVDGEHVDSAARRISPQSSHRSKSPASTSVLSGLSERSEKIMEEWGFTDSRTAQLMLRRAQNMKPKKHQQKKHKDPSVRLALFRNCSYQVGPVEARHRPAPHSRNYVKVGVTELGLQQTETTEQVKHEPAQQWLHTQAAQPDRPSESERFLPEINSSVLNGGRVQLMADPAYTDRQHHASGLWANSSLAAQPYKVNSSSRRNSLGRGKKEDPSPKRASSAPSKKERISFRDSPVQLSGGWGGGKKRDRVCK